VTPEAHDLIELRLAQAKDSLTEARLLIGTDMCRDAMDGIYFTMFYCACALLATKEFGPSKHGDVAAKFQREFVGTGLIPKEIGERFRRTTQLHQETNLGAHVTPNDGRLKEWLADAENFLTTTKLFLGK
jgi:uncharacterized protein (UPF0332 family)